MWCTRAETYRWLLGLGHHFISHLDRICLSEKVGNSYPGGLKSHNSLRPCMYEFDLSFLLPDLINDKPASEDVISFSFASSPQA